MNGTVHRNTVWKQGINAAPGPLLAWSPSPEEGRAERLAKGLEEVRPVEEIAVPETAVATMRPTRSGIRNRPELKEG